MPLSYTLGAAQLSLASLLVTYVAFADARSVRKTPIDIRSRPWMRDNYQGIHIKTWEDGWTGDGIRRQYAQLDGVADIAFLAFLKPSLNGLECNGSVISACAPVWDANVGLYGKEVFAADVYRNASLAAKAETGLLTILTIGGWNFRNEFAFLAGLIPSQIRQWALQVKNWVDHFGADGVDLDYQAEAPEQWENEIVKTDILGALREVMPESSGYLIVLSIPGLAGVQGPKQAIKEFFDPPLNFDYSIGYAVSTIAQNHNDLDILQLKTFDGEPNLNPLFCMDLTRQSTERQLGESIKHKIAMGVKLGMQQGNCQIESGGWCELDLARVLTMTDYVKRNGFAGIFYWSNIEDREVVKIYYNTTYRLLGK